jgi:lipid II:glycine glycyltransferase (peptidoglycan interpeptide bridge formation enzyme)
MIECIKSINNLKIDNLPVLASENYLKTLSKDYGWFVSETFIIPYVSYKKFIFKYLTFTSETIPLTTLTDEKQFLNELIVMLKKFKFDFITQPPTHVLFNSYPDKSEFIDFGTYIIDLTQSEEIIFKNIYKEHKRHIRKSVTNGIVIERGHQLKDICYKIINDKQHSQGIHFMKKEEFDDLVINLKNNLEFFITRNNEKYEIAILILWDKHSAYTIYSGSISEHDLGSNNLLIWEAIRYFKSINVHNFNFVGARINPNPDSKHYRIQDFKKRFGGELKTGYLWKYNFHPLKKQLFDYLIYLKTGKKPLDIIDYESKKS